jgi:uncharacterized protein YPO0396
VSEKEKYLGDERRTQPKWRVTKDISVADIVAVVSAFVAILFAYTTLDKRVTLAENSIAVLRNSQSYAQDQINTHLRDLNNKLDRVMEMSAFKKRDN